MRSSRQPAAAFRRVRDRGHGLRRLPPTMVAAAVVTLVAAVAAAGCATGSKTARSAAATSRATSVTSVRDYLGADGPADQLPLVNAAVYKACRAGQASGLIPASTYIAGYADASKQNGAVPVGFPDLAPAVTANSQEGFGGAPPVIVNGQRYTCGIVKLQLDYDGLAELPPVTATFLAFGFMPVTATIHLVQPSPGPILAVVYQDASIPASAPPYTAVSATTISLQLTDVKVNGVPLDAGLNCHSSGPVYTPELDTELGLPPNTAVLTGGNAFGDPLPQYAQANRGGALAGVVTIPPFTDCVTPAGENLDTLLDASVSGPGNYLKVVQGPLCLNPAIQPNPLCTAQKLPVFEPLWTVSHGGSYTGAGQVQIQQLLPASTTITCPGSIAGEIPDLIGPLRDAGLGTVTWAGTTCMGTSAGYKRSTWTLQQPRQQQAPAILDGKLYPYPASGITTGGIDDLTFVLTQTKGSEPGCTATLAGNTGTTYTNASSALDLIPGSFVPVTSSTCKELPVSGGSNGTNNDDDPTTFTGSYVLSPSGITIVSP